MRRPSAEVRGVRWPHAADTACLFDAGTVEKRRESSADRAAEVQGEVVDDATDIGDKGLRRRFAPVVGRGYPVYQVGGLIHVELLKNVMNKACSGSLARPRGGGRLTGGGGERTLHDPQHRPTVTIRSIRLDGV